MKLTIITTVLMMSFSAMALEVDNYYGEMGNLKDSNEIVNEFINSSFESKLKSLSPSLLKNPNKCSKIHYKLIKQFRSIIKHKLEGYLEKNLSSEFMHPAKNVGGRKYFDDSIYDRGRFDITRIFSMSRNIQINGIVIGTDKLSHFISTGLRYFNTYKKALRKGKSQEKAFKKAIHFGVFTERYILGKMGSGVFSYGDLEANFNGLLMNIRFCGDVDNSYLKYINGRWELNSRFDIGEYVNPNWSEVFNRSFFAKGKWRAVKRNFKKLYCGENGKILQQKLDFYHSILLEESFSAKYLRKLRSTSTLEKLDPKRQKLSCD